MKAWSAIHSQAITWQQQKKAHVFHSHLQRHIGPGFQIINTSAAPSFLFLKSAVPCIIIPPALLCSLCPSEPADSRVTRRGRGDGSGEGYMCRHPELAVEPSAAPLQQRGVKYLAPGPLCGGCWGTAECVTTHTRTHSSDSPRWRRDSKTATAVAKLWCSHHNTQFNSRGWVLEHNSSYTPAHSCFSSPEVQSKAFIAPYFLSS